MDSVQQLVRYGVVGVGTNALLFAGYLALSHGGMGTKAALSLLYVPGVLLGFIGNRNFTFRHNGTISLAMTRYLATCAIAYVLNFACVVVLVDTVGVPAEWVVLGLMVGTAAALFLLQRHWIFAHEAPRDPEITAR